MASKSTKAKNNKKLSSGVDAGTHGPPPMLALVQEAATLDSNTSIKQAAEITLKIVQKVQSVKDHRANFQRLADDVAGLIARIWKSYQELPADEKQNWPPKNDIEELVLKLEPILAFVEEQVKRSRTDRVLSSFTDSGKIQEYRERVQRAIRLFEINHPRINNAPHRVRVEEEKERTPDAELRQLTEKKKARMIEEEPHRLQAEGKIRVTDEEARQPRRLSHICDEQAKERLQDPELESDHHDKEERREIERLRDVIRVMEEAKKAAEQKERERKREEKEEMDRIAAKERESERRQGEEMAREAEEQRKRERIRIAEMQLRLERRKVLEQIRVTDEEARHPQQSFHISDEQAKEGLQDPESDHHDKEERREIERLRDEIRVMKKAKAAEEKERERKREEKEELNRIAAKERENERRRQSEEMARVEAEEQRRRERIRIAEEDSVMRRMLERKKALEQEAMERLREPKATRTAGMESIASEEDESGEESSSEAAVRKPADKNKKANNAPTVPSVGAFRGQSPSPAPPMFPPSLHPGHYPVDVSPHPWYPYGGPTNGSPPATNHISGFNNSRIAGGIKIGNVTNSDSTRGGDAVPRQEQAAVPRQKHASRQGKRAKSRKVTF